jgi:hypothetical protein
VSIPRVSEPTEDQIHQYLGSAPDEELLELLWQAISTSEQAQQVLLDHIDSDAGPARAALEAAANETAAGGVS